jgi:hypothetical protein
MNDVVKEKKKMGRKVILTPDRIIEAIKNLEKNCSEVTPCTIRRDIGSGGLGNISSVLESYLKDKNGISLSENEPKETHILAPDLEDKLNILISDLSLQLNNFALESDQLANNIAEKRARSSYETMIDNNRKLIDEQTLTIKIFDEVEAKNDELINHISNIESQLLDEQKNSITLDKVISKANDELTNSKHQILELQTSLATSTSKNHSLEKLITKA